MLVKNIQKALLSKIKTITWMDSVTRIKALEKAASINLLVAYPEYYKDVNYIEDYFKNVHICGFILIFNLNVCFAIL